MVLVEGLALVIHQRIAGPGLRDQHHHRVRHRVAALHQELERVVEARRVRLALVGNRPQLLDVGAELLRFRRRLARRHPVDVAAQRVDLAVVRHHPVGMGQPPRRERVGGEALMHQRQRRFEALVGQVAVVGPQLVGQEHALVDHRPTAQRHDVELGLLALGLAVDRVGDDLAQDVEAPLEAVLVDLVGAAADEHLHVHRLDVGYQRRQPGVVHRHGAPAEQHVPLGLDRRRDDLLAVGAQRVLARHEYHRHGVLARLRQLEAQPAAFLRVEGVRDLAQHAGAVADQRIRADRPAMGQVDEDLQALLDDPVGLAAVQVADEADAAGVVLGARTVEAGGGRPGPRGARGGAAVLRVLAGLGRGHDAHWSTRDLVHRPHASSGSPAAR